MVWSILLGAAGIYCIVMGIRTIITGSLPPREEERIKEYSQKGARLYKLVNAGMNIFGGLIVIAMAVIRYLENQGILTNIIPYWIALLVAVVIMLIVFFVTRAKCKNMKDD